jgi:hypothetical protein
VRFLPAFQLGNALASAEPPNEQDFLLLLGKLQARHAATEPIAQIAAAHWGA